jgi:hypothetical protein
MYVRTYVCMYLCMCVCMFVCMYVRTYVCVCMYVCMCVCMFVCIYILCTYVFFTHYFWYSNRFHKQQRLLTVIAVPAHDMKAYRDSRGTAPVILNLNARCEWSTSHPGLFIPREEPRWPLNRRQRQPQGRSVRFEGEKNLWNLSRFEPRTAQHSVVCKPVNRFLMHHVDKVRLK